MIADVTSLVADGVEAQQACSALCVWRATWYRHQSSTARTSKPRPTPARALSVEQRQEVLDTLCQDRFIDRSPPHVVATLLSEGEYLCSVRTMYRILEDNKSSVVSS